MDQEDRILSSGQCFVSSGSFQSVRGRWSEICDHRRSGQTSEISHCFDSEWRLGGTGVIGVIAYNLFMGFKRLACPQSWVKQTIATFRWKMVQVAGRIAKHAGEVVLKLMIDLEKLELFKEISHKSFELSLCPDG
jgi:hypothetical protein